jgi:flagellar biosynthesis protein
MPKNIQKDPERNRRKAVAIRYDATDDNAPRLIAKGEGLVAEKIIEIATENNIHIHEDPLVVAMLAKLEVNTFVPEELYKAVAEILAFVYRLDQRVASQPHQP